MNNKHSNYLICISIDALNITDKNYIKNLSNFKDFFSNGAYAEEVVGIYPSLTYPSHATIVTGVYPNKHKIYSNTKNQPSKKELDWFWTKDEIKTKTIFDYAQEKNLTIGTILWPVMCKAPFNYVFPEIIPHKGENILRKFLNNGTPLFILSSFLKYRKLLDGFNQPNLDEFSTSCFCNMIEKKKPNLSFLHLIELDDIRHKYGLKSPHTHEALKRINKRLGKIINSTKKAGIYDKCTFVLLGDHGFKSFDKIINLNVIFKKHGLITTDNNNDIIDWKVYSNTCNGSAQIFINTTYKEEVYDLVYKILKKLEITLDSGVKKVYTLRELENKYSLNGDFHFMVEAEDGYAINNDLTEEYMLSREEYSKLFPSKKSYKGHHGYDPYDKDYKTLFLAKGFGIKKGISIPKINLVDEAPTMAAILGIKMEKADGKIITDILEKTV